MIKKVCVSIKKQIKIEKHEKKEFNFGAFSC